MERKLSRYLSMNYRYELIRDEDEGGYFAHHPELNGCAAQGETAEEAIANLDAARKLWLDTRIKDDLPIPGPVADEPSGRFLLRMPPWLQAQLVKQATQQGVSLNSLLVSVLAAHAGGDDYRWKLEKLLEKVTSKVDELCSAAESVGEVVVHGHTAFLDHPVTTGAPYLISTELGVVAGSLENELKYPDVVPYIASTKSTARRDQD